MTIEPISSVMTAQAQPVVAAKPVAPTEKTAEFSQQEAMDNGAASGLDTTQVVEKAQNSQNQNDFTKDKEENPVYQQNAQATNEQIKKAVERFNKSSGANTEAVFGIHEGTNRVTIKIVDKDSKKIIKELPPDKTLDMIAKVWEMAGILVDEKR